jgi:hypothetical protein
MTVRLHLRRIRVVKVLRDDEAELVVEVADAQSVKRCPACGARTATVHEVLLGQWLGAGSCDLLSWWLWCGCGRR